MKYLYLIPARGGSKGIPGKNIKPLGGIPLIGHTIRTALQIADAEDVVVSTDSDDIARVSKEFGASVPFMRPDALCLGRTPLRYCPPPLLFPEADSRGFSAPCGSPCPPQNTAQRWSSFLSRKQESFCSPR